MPKGLLSDHQNDRLNWYKRGIACNAVLSTLFTYRGAELLTASADWYDKGTAAGVAAASGITIYVTWRTLESAVSDERTIPQLAFAGFKTALAVPAIAAASTWLMVAGFAKDDVDRVHMNDYLANAQSVGSTYYQNALQLSGSGVELASLATDLDNWAKLEEKTGFSTGTPGEGAVSFSLNDASGWIATYRDQVTNVTARVEGDRKTAVTAATGMRNVTTSTETLAQRAHKFSKLNEQWRASTVRLDIRRKIDALVRNVESSAQNFGKVVKLSDKPSIRAKQLAALDKYRAVLSERTRTIASGMKAASDADYPELPTLSPISVVLGVLTYWTQYISFWLLGLGIDFAAPLIMLLSLHGVRIAKTEQEKFADAMFGMPVITLLMAEYVEKLRRGIALDADSVQQINDRLIGKPDDKGKDLTNG